MSTLPVVDYDRVRRIHVPSDPLPGSEYNLGTRICIVLISFGFILLLKRWLDKKSSSSNVRLQKV